MAKAKAKPKAKPKAKAKSKAKPRVKPKAKPKAKAKPRPRPERAKPRTLGDRLLEALDAMQDVAPGATLAARKPPTSVSRTPWIMLARFGMPGGSTYDDVLAILEAWESSRQIEKLIGKSRASRIQVRYVTDRGKEGEYTLAEIGPWASTVSRAVERVGIRDDRDEPLVERYGEGSDHQSDIDAIVVWFSETEFETIG